jgi:Flp pilus assembly protein TadD
VDAHTSKALARLQHAAEAVKARVRYTPEDFGRQKKFLGWCATTNMLCGEAAEDANDMAEARAQYSEVIKMEPQNPWGWMKRGFLGIKTADRAAALADLREALKIVPNSPEALAAHEYLAHTGKRGKK